MPIPSNYSLFMTFFSSSEIIWRDKHCINQSIIEIFKLYNMDICHIGQSSQIKHHPISQLRYLQGYCDINKFVRLWPGPRVYLPLNYRFVWAHRSWNQLDDLYWDRNKWVYDLDMTLHIEFLYSTPGFNLSTKYGLSSLLMRYYYDLHIFKKMEGVVICQSSAGMKRCHSPKLMKKCSFIRVTVHVSNY